MDDYTKEELLKGLTATPKYIPAWYRYDNEGSRLNDLCLTESKWYYFHQYEVNLLQTHVEEITSQLNISTLVDLGSGNAVKTRMLLDKMLSSNNSLTYIPVDISGDFLHSVADKIKDEYGHKIEVKPIASEYLEALKQLRLLKHRKLFVWFGSLQSLPYKHQIRYCSAISDSMQADDMLLLTTDITDASKKDLIEKAYIAGPATDLHLNSIHRLNKEWNGDVNLSMFEIKDEFVHDPSPGGSSFVKVWIEAKENCSFKLPGLGISLCLEKGEKLFLHEEHGISYKYTLPQINHIIESSSLIVDRYWTNTHVGAFLLRNQQSIIP